MSRHGACESCGESRQLDDGEGVCEACWSGPMSAGGLSMCRLCWDEVGQPGAQLCEWCAMTPEQRRRYTLIGWLVCAASAAVVLGAITWMGWHHG